MMRDALNNELVEGAIYGYSNRKNGFVNVTVGKLIKVTEARATLETVEHRSALYKDNTNLKPEHTGSIIHVIPNMIFRLKHLEND